MTVHSGLIPYRNLPALSTGLCSLETRNGKRLELGHPGSVSRFPNGALARLFIDIGVPEN